MLKRRFLLLAGLLLTFIIVGMQVFSNTGPTTPVPLKEGPPTHMAPFTASNLLNEKVTLPQEAYGQQTLIMVAFVKEQQFDINNMLAAMQPVLERHKGTDYIEVPVVKRFNPVYRWMIDGFMRGGIPSEAARKRTVTYYTNVPAFLKYYNLPNADSIFCMLIDRQGQIWWQHRGNYVAGLEQGLEAALAKNNQYD